MGKDADMERFLTVTSGVNPMYIYILVLYAHSTEAQIHFTRYTVTQLVAKRLFSGQNILFYSFSLWKAFSDLPGDAWSRTKMWQSHFQVLGLNEDCQGAPTSQVILPLDHWVLWDNTAGNLSLFPPLTGVWNRICYILSLKNCSLSLANYWKKKKKPKKGNSDIS